MAKLNEITKAPIIKAEDKHPKRKTEWIHYKKLTRNEKQFYAEDEDYIKSLADKIILSEGVLQNLVVRKIDAEKYEIIGGHKRWLACKYITEKLKIKGFNFIPCYVTNISDAKAHWNLIATNNFHAKTPFEIMREIEEMKKLLKEHPEELTGEDKAKGRAVERIAEELGMSRSVVSDYNNISKNLIEKGKQALEEGRIDKSTAVQLAGLPQIEQLHLLKSNENLTNKKIKEYKEKQKENENKALPKKEPTDRFPYVSFVKSIRINKSDQQIFVGSLIDIKIDDNGRENKLKNYIVKTIDNKYITIQQVICKGKEFATKKVALENILFIKKL